MRPGLLRAYTALCVLAFIIPIGAAISSEAHKYFIFANLLVAIFASLDAFAWQLTSKRQTDDLFLNVIQALRIAFLAEVVLVANFVAFTNPGPVALMDWNFWIFLGFMGFFLMYSLLWLQLPRRDSLLLGHTVRCWKLGVPKLRVAHQYCVLLAIFTVMELGLVLSPIRFDLSEEADLLNFVILNGFSVIIFCLVGPIFWIALKVAYTKGDNCFLSYSRADGEPADAIRQGLERRGIGCFQDIAGVQAGDEISPALGEAIANSDVFIPLLSAASLQSPWVRDEIFLALHYAKMNGSPVIIPSRICDLEAIDAWETGGNDVAAMIRAMNILDLGMDKETMEAAMDRLAATIKKKSKPSINL